MIAIDTNGMRFRQKEATKNLVASYTTDYSTSPDGAFPSVVPPTSLTVANQIDDRMWDVVTKDFRARSAAGEIFNSPKLHIREDFRVTPLNGTYNLMYQTRNSEGVYKDAFKRRIVMSNIAVDETYVDRLKTLTVPYDRLQNLAVTAAYAGVTATEQNAILWLGEFRETVSMFKDIGSSLWELWKKTKKQRLKWAQGKLTVPEAQSLTLGLLYGLLPLEESINQVMAGLFKIKEDHTRQTSRGFQVYTDSNSVSNDRVWGDYGEGTATLSYTETIEVTVRAGVLYDIDVTDLPTFLVVANPKAIVETAYALARMSFVIDWFINVGNTLAAWSPSTGTNILSAWVSIEETYVISGMDHQMIKAGVLKDGQRRITGSYDGSFPFEKTLVKKQRAPINRSDLAIFPRVDVNLDLDKIFALVLLFAKAKKP